MNNLNKQKAFRLRPSEALSKEMLSKLQEINKHYSQSADFSKYMRDLGELFGISPVQITEEKKRFLGGFIEGEASINVSAKRLEKAQFGMIIDPEFSITQHVNGFSTLYLALSIFRTGRIRHKNGSNATLVVVIDNRQSLEQKVVPFYEKYVKPYGSEAKAERLENLIKILELFKQGGHKDLKTFRDELLPIWDSMRIQKGQSNETFASLEAAQKFVTEFAQNKNK